jgi:2-polyprenyl-3-methyl-5-hydroxy-6-metoxy-1,4-benzoquinol methylase
MARDFGRPDKLRCGGDDTVRDNTDDEEERREAERHDRLYAEQRSDVLVMRPSAWERFDHVAEPLTAYVASVLQLGDIRGKRVLDMGCGDGWYSVILAKRGADVSGYDISAAAIETARERARQNGVTQRTQFDVASAYALPYGDSTFDVVTGQSILHHLVDTGRLASELKRVMKPGATAVFCEPFAGVRWLRRVRRWVPVPSQAPDDPDQTQFSYADAEALGHHFRVELREFQLLARLDRVVRAAKVVQFLGKADRVLLRSVPFLRRYAGAVVVTLRSEQPA